MRSPFRNALLALAAFAVVLAGAAPADADTKRTPENTVRQYLEALQSSDYEAAWSVISDGMKQGRPKEAWVKESLYMAQLAELKIFEFKVYTAKVEGDEARVPNILSSQDKFLNQLGVDEYEVYKLVKEKGEWKVDHQELVIGESEKAKWFRQPSEE